MKTYSSELSRLHWKTLSNAKFQLAVLPWGATEAHNYHLPYGTDNFETEAFGREAVADANLKGAGAILLPGIPFGVNTGQKGINLTINMHPSTQFLVLRDILQSVYDSGIKKFLLLNGHGGNDFKQMLREMGSLFPDMILVSCNWYQAVDKSIYFTNDGDHADEMETSLMMYLHPELVLPLSQAGEGRSKKFAVEALNEKWAWSERKWSRVTGDTGIGNPALSDAGKGKKYFEDVKEKLTELIIGLSRTDEKHFFIDR